MNAKEQERQEAVRELREILKPGDTVFTKIEHVSRSGMSRVISVFLIRENQRVYLDHRVGAACDYKMHRRYDGLTVGGCGMDMGFALVYDLSRVLFPDGFECIGEGADYKGRCPSNDHSNGDRDFTPHHHQDGGYALKQRWF